MRRGAWLTSAICGVPRTLGAHLLVVGGPLQRTKLTVGTPAPPSITATLGLGDRVPVAGRHLTQRGQHLGEAEALADIYGEEERDTEGKGGRREVRRDFKRDSQGALSHFKMTNLSDQDLT